MKGTMTTYKIIRKFEDPATPNHVLKEHLTYDEAWAHIESPESASHTTQTTAGQRRFRRFGPWWDDMEEE